GFAELRPEARQRLASVEKIENTKKQQ
ncbi:MAG: hypothetical protein JWM91_4062, partial [Rhodospirillales bacterium]|nr:hypothetical protein [Rhodospirillales bacterium]